MLADLSRQCFRHFTRVQADSAIRQTARESLPPESRIGSPSLPSLGLQSWIFRRGCVSRAINCVFMENASTAAMLGYLPIDGPGLYVALTEIDRHSQAVYPGRLGER